MPEKPSSQPGLSRVCASCSATVERQNCHKNRYSQYICRQCQDLGIKFTNRSKRRYFHRRRYVLTWAFSVVILGVAAGLAFPAIWMEIMPFDPDSSFSSASSSSYSYSSSLLSARRPEAPIDAQGGIVINPESSPRLFEGLGPPVLPLQIEVPWTIERRAAH